MARRRRLKFQKNKVFVDALRTKMMVMHEGRPRRRGRRRVSMHSQPAM